MKQRNKGIGKIMQTSLNVENSSKTFSRTLANEFKLHK